MPYWVISVWSWAFSFCNNVGTGVALGTNSTFGYALATVLAQGVSILSFILLTDVIYHGDHNTLALGLSGLLSDAVYFAVIVHTIFFYEKCSRLVPRPSWDEFWSSETWVWTVIAGKAGSSLMINMLAGQISGTVSTQMLARMGTGLQYRASVFGTISGNFWMPVILGYTMRIGGSKMWGAKWYAAYYWFARLCINGTVLLCVVAAVVQAAFYKSAAWAFASDKICELLESACTSPEYEQLYGGDFMTTYFVNAVLPQVSAVLSTMQACLFAAQDFDYVRNISMLALVCCFTPLAVAGYALDSFLLLQIAPYAGSVFMCIACWWRFTGLLDLESWTLRGDERSSRERKAQALTASLASRNYAKAGGESTMGESLLGGGGGGGGGGFTLQE